MATPIISQTATQARSRVRAQNSTARASGTHAIKLTESRATSAPNSGRTRSKTASAIGST